MTPKQLLNRHGKIPKLMMLLWLLCEPHPICVPTLLQQLWYRLQRSEGDRKEREREVSYSLQLYAMFADEIEMMKTFE